MTMLNQNRVTGIIFSNTHDDIITNLTQNRTLGSVPFGGRYRLIDFPLSNMVNSGVSEVGIITKYNYQSLIDHLATGREWDLARKVGGLHILPPFGDAQHGLYRGKIDALGGALGYLTHSTAKHVILSDCNVITNMDARPMLQQHIKSEADITVLYQSKYITPEDAKHSTILATDSDGWVTDVAISPDVTGRQNVHLDMAILEKDFLIRLIRDCLSKGQYDFERDVLQAKRNELKILGYRYDGFIRKISSMKSYFDANMDLLSREVRSILFPPERAVYTKIRDEVPVKYGIDAIVRNSLIADGCIVEGQVENSILFRGVHVREGAVVKNSIIMQGAVVGQKCEINYAIADKNVLFTDYRGVSGSVNYPAFVEKDTLV